MNPCESCKLTPDEAMKIGGCPFPLVCDLCGKMETVPYDVGDSCSCGGIFNLRCPNI
jgi:hypothetical protein